MYLADVINVLGQHSLREFSWGPLVVIAVESFTPEHPTITLDSTGNDIRGFISSLSETDRQRFLTTQIDPAKATMTTDVGGGMTLEHHLTPVMQQPRSIIEALLSVFVLVVLVVAVFLTGTLEPADAANAADTVSTLTEIMKLIVGN